ncbi:MAG: DUF3060 domain-containing protein [Acidobacteriota bacterium]
MRPTRIFITAIVFAFYLLVSFESGLKVSPTNQVLAASLKAPLNSEGVIVIRDNGGRLDIKCQRRDVEVRGNRNDIILHGRCRRVSVLGNENRVNIKVVDEIDISGNNNDVWWLDGFDGRHPRISNRGRNNTVNRH